MTTHTDSDTIGAQLGRRHVEYLESRMWDLLWYVVGFVSAIGMYPTLAAGDSAGGWTLALFAFVSLGFARAGSRNGFCNRVYNASLGQLTESIDETSEDKKGDLGWQ